jgi:hypothetical protein
MRRLTPALAVIAAMLALPALAGEQPPKPTTSTDPAKCSWEWRSENGLGVWAERCELDTGLWHLEYHADLPGFVLFASDDEIDTVLQTFRKPADKDISAILPELRKRGYIPDDDECVFEPAAISPTPKTLAQFEIKPTGARQEAFDKTPDDEIPEPPCGDYGWSTHGIRYFVTDTTHPETVVYVNIGQDGMMFDPATVTLK